MTDLHDDFEMAFRRVPHEPLLEDLARQVVDRLEQWKADGLVVRLSSAIRLAREFGVPLDYVFAERERRVRERQG
jgi:hypothetical protein